MCTTAPARIMECNYNYASDSSALLLFTGPTQYRLDHALVVQSGKPSLISFLGDSDAQPWSVPLKCPCTSGSAEDV